MRIQQELPIEPGQPFTIDRFRPEDGAGVASLFLSVYGPDYPVAAYYDPDQIVALHAKGDLFSVVARTPRGDVIGHGALYRSSPPHARLYEIGQLIVAPVYRGSFAAYKINAYLVEKLSPEIPLDGVFGEAVCNHTMTQKSSVHFRFWETALELDLLPRGGDQQASPPDARVSCVVVFRNYRDTRRRAFIPPAYAEEIAFLLRSGGLDRDLQPAVAALPSPAASQVAIAWFNAASVGRFTVAVPGADFEARVRQIEAAADAQKIAVRQCFLCLEAPWVAPAVEILRDHRYFLAGYVPRWFDSDGLLLQKLTHRPNFDGIKLHTEKARRLLEYVRADWQRTQ